MDISCNGAKMYLVIFSSPDSCYSVKRFLPMSWILEHFVVYLSCVYIVYIYICSAGSVELPVVVLLYLLQCLVYHMMSKTRRNSRSLHRVIGYNYICYIYLVYKFG